MPAEPHALIRANHACREQLPANANLFFPSINGTLVSINNCEECSSGRVRIYYSYSKHRRQLTIDGDTWLVISFDNLTGHDSNSIFQRAKCASSPFRGWGTVPRTIEVTPHTTSVLTALHGANFFG